MTVFNDEYQFGDTQADHARLDELDEERREERRRSFLADGFDVKAEDVPATHTRIRVASDGEEVGSVDVIEQGGVLSVGAITVSRPAGMSGEGWPAHKEAVQIRLLAEVVRLADQRKAPLLMMLPAGSSFAERVRAAGFVDNGTVWHRAERAAS